MKRKIKGGLTSVSLPVFIADTSSTIGGGLSGVTHSSSGLVLEYRRAGASSWTSVTAVSKTLGTYVSGGIVDDGSLSGAYEVDFPDAAFAAGARFVLCRIRGVTNMLPVLIEIELDAVDYQNADSFGLSRIDATVSSRASQTSLDTLDGYVDTEVAAIKAKTDNLPASPAAVSDIPTANQNRDAVWNALMANYTTANTFGLHVVRSVNSNNQVEITGGGSHHVFAVIHDSEPNSIHEDAFDDGAVSARVIAENAITSTQLAPSALTEIKDAVATITPIADLATMITNDGTANARYTVSALQNGPSGEGGSTINVYPVSASTPERVAGTTITFYRDEARAVSVVTDFTLTSLTLKFIIEDAEGTDVLVIEDGSISRSSQTFTVTIPDSVTAKPTNYKWALRDITGATNSVLARGVFSVQEAASDA